MKRRSLLVALGAGAIAAPLACLAQQSKLRRIGFLAVRSRATLSNPESYYDAFVTAMRALGYAEGVNLAIEWRFGEGRYERLPGLALELAQMKPEVIVTHSTPATEALQRATRTIPIVTASVGDPVGRGFATSLARPGGNITGLSAYASSPAGKHLELLKNAVPRLSRIALLVNPGSSAYENIVRSVQAAGKKLGLNVLRVDARSSEDIERGFEAMSRDRAGAVIVTNDSFYIAQRRQITALALEHRLPSVFHFREDVVAGGLMSYGHDVSYNYRRAADYVDKILKGAKPSELPIEQPTKFHLAINRKTAKALGVAISKELEFRADEVIE
jgi:putative ABC transport system substrate-binding protein